MSPEERFERAITWDPVKLRKVARLFHADEREKVRARTASGSRPRRQRRRTR